MGIVWSILALILGVVVAYLMYEEYVVEREKEGASEAEKEIEDDLREIAAEAGVGESVAPLPERVSTEEVEVEIEPETAADTAGVDVSDSIDSLPERVAAAPVAVAVEPVAAAAIAEDTTVEVVEDPVAEEVTVEEVALEEVAEVEDVEAEDVEASAPAETPEADDLTKIKGVGKVYSQRLNEAGIYTYQQLIDTDTETLIKVTKAIPAANAVDWGRQAQRLM